MIEFELTKELDSDAAIEHLNKLIQQNRRVYNIEVVFKPGSPNPAKMPNPEMWIYDDPKGSDPDAIKKDCMRLVTDATGMFGKPNIRFEIIHD